MANAKSDDFRAKIMELRMAPDGTRRGIRTIVTEMGLLGFHVTKNTVHKILQEEEAERHEIAVEVVKDHIGKHVASNLDVLSELQRGNLSAWRAMAPVADADGRVLPPKGVSIRDWVALGREAREVTETQFRLCGLDPTAPLGEATGMDTLTDEQLDAELAELRAIVAAVGE